MEHTPVLLEEVIHFLDPKIGDAVIDGTVDGGGHAAAIIKKIMPEGNFLGLDWDNDLLEKCRKRLGHIKNVNLLKGNYAELPEILRKEKMEKADCLLLDLGFSSEQLERSGRGFSFGEAAKDEPLLMTYSDEQVPVAKLIRELNEEDLAKIIFEFGGERMSRRIAKAIKLQGKKKAITTSGELAQTIRDAVPKNYERGRIDAATRTFQALRIYANNELGNLETFFENLNKIMKPGGRVAIISFHSLEDKIVKKSLRDAEKKGYLKILTKKPVIATESEMRSNPRSRSAKLRAGQVI